MTTASTDSLNDPMSGFKCTNNCFYDTPPPPNGTNVYLKWYF